MRATVKPLVATLNYRVFGHPPVNPSNVSAHFHRDGRLEHEFPHFGQSPAKPPPHRGDQLFFEALSQINGKLTRSRA